MSTREWSRVPIGINANRWVTRAGCRTVLAVTHTIASCHRLLDLVEHVEDDPRVQVVFTIAPDTFNHRVAGYLERLGALVLPWHQAVREPFDLGLATSYGGLHELHAPLVVMAHGAGHGKLVQPAEWGGPVLTEPAVYGLDAQRLARNGRVLASALVLSHEGELDVLRRQCPEAVGAAVIGGDPCFDRLIASLPWRGRYRRALGVEKQQDLVVVSSTWGRDGLFGHWPDLLPLLLNELPAKRYRIAVQLHPAVWSAHGDRQVRAWLRDCLDAGLLLLDPAEDWRGLVVAADYLIGDHGSVTAYGAAIGRQVLLLAGLEVTSAVGSAQDLVARSAARLDPRLAVPPQLRAARSLDHQTVVAALTSRPGDAGILLRRTMYRLLDLTEPARHRRIGPVPVPRTATEDSPT